MDDCTNCYYKNYCKDFFHIFAANPCDPLSPKELKEIDDFVASMGIENEYDHSKNYHTY